MTSYVPSQQRCCGFRASILRLFVIFLPLLFHLTYWSNIRKHIQRETKKKWEWSRSISKNTRLSTLIKLLVHVIPWSGIKNRSDTKQGEAFWKGYLLVKS